jgi:hypothetical protein
VVAVLVTAIVVGAPSSGRAAPPAEAMREPAALVLIVGSDGADVDREAIRAAVEREIGGRVVLGDLAAGARGVLAVSLRAARGELAVSYTDERRGTIMRVVAAPPTAADLVRDVAWLAGNLVRDEADELLPHGPALVPPPAPAPPAPPVVVPPPVAGPPPAAVVTVAPPAPSRAPVTVSLFYPLATNFDAPDVRTLVALNMIYGRVGAVDLLGLGTVNVVDGKASGVQLGLIANRAGAVDGLQAAPVNAAGDVHGAQIGLVNVARRVRGVQLGLVNIADDIEGVPIGLVSVSNAGGVHPTVWSSVTSSLNVGVKFATRYTYTQVSVSTTVAQTLVNEAPDVINEQSGRKFGPGFALGFRVPMSRRLTFESDLYASYLFGGPLSGVTKRAGFQDDLALDSLRAMLAFEISRRFSLFAGAAVTAETRFYQGPDDVTVKLVPDFLAGIQL